MKKGFFTEGYSRRKITEVDLLIADYMTNSVDDKIGETNTVWLHEAIIECWDSSDDDERAECYFIIDPNGKAVGYAELYDQFEVVT